MSKLLFIFEQDMPTVSITKKMMENLEEYPEIVSDFKYLTDVTHSDIDAHDVIIFIRPLYQYGWRIAKKARRAGHTIIVHCDDDLLNLPKTYPTIPWRKKALIKTLNNADIILSSSRYILNEYGNFTAGKRTVLTNTIVHKEEFDGISTEKNDKNQIKIVYAAASSHAALFEKNIKPIVPKLIEEFGDSISFTFVGVHPDMGDLPCEYVAGMPLQEYREYMKKSGFDIGLAPLNEDEFSKKKYFNKFLEYTTQGITGIYTNSEPYTYVVQDKVNGLLTENKPEAWLESIRAAILSRELRENCLKNAVQYIKENHSEKAVIEALTKDIPEFVNSENAYEKCRPFTGYRFLYYLSRPFDWLYMTAFYLKNNGMHEVADRAKVHIKGHAYSKR